MYWRSGARTRPATYRACGVCSDARVPSCGRLCGAASRAQSPRSFVHAMLAFALRYVVDRCANDLFLCSRLTPSHSSLPPRPLLSLVCIPALRGFCLGSLVPVHGYLWRGIATARAPDPHKGHVRRVRMPIFDGPPRLCGRTVPSALRIVRMGRLGRVLTLLRPRQRADAHALYCCASAARRALVRGAFDATEPRLQRQAMPS